jgi:hypothetical protein
MGGWRTYVHALLVAVVVCGQARGDAVTWRWVIWAPGQEGDVVTNLQGPTAFAAGVSTSETPPTSSVVTPMPAPSSGMAQAIPPIPAPATTTGPSASWTPPAPVVGQPIAPVPPETIWQLGPQWSNTAASGSSSASTSGMADGFINFGTGPYASASQLTSGNAQPWYTSPAVTQFFGGIPNAQERADFTNTVLQRVEQTYQMSGVPVQLTTDPNVPAAHSISVVSGTGSPVNSQFAGVTTEGGDGFSFIDKFAGAQSLDQLEWVVAHNIAHELMHAFGGEHHDLTGAYLDSAMTPWSTMTNPNTIFSPAEVQDLLSHNFKQNVSGAGADGQIVAGLPAAAPEPGSLLAWASAACLLGVVRQVRRGGRSTTPAH